MRIRSTLKYLLLTLLVLLTVVTPRSAKAATIYEYGKQIWNGLIGHGFTEYQAAGIMGNIYAESVYCPTNAENRVYPSTDDSAYYPQGISRYTFGNDGIGYGIAQWTYYSRKLELWDFAAARGTSVSDMNTQIAFLLKELDAGYYSTRIKSMSSIESVSDYFMVNFEKPANQSEAAKETRRTYGRNAYSTYGGGSVDIDEYYKITLPADDSDGGLVIRSAPGGSRLGVAKIGSVVHITGKQYYSGQEWGYGTTDDGVTGWMCIGLSGATQKVSGYTMPSNAYVSVSSTLVTLGDSVTISWGADNATSYVLHIVAEGNDNVRDEGTNTSRSFKFTGNAGNVIIYVVASNAYGSVNSVQTTVKVVAEGSALTEGYDRVLPDGDYLIATAATNDKSSFYFLDIEGTAQPAENDSNVSLCGPLTSDPPAYEIWTLAYDSSDKCYTIKQKGTDMCLDVYKGYLSRGTNVAVYQLNGDANQKWAISKNSGDGYRIQAKHSGLSLDIANGTVANGTNVQQYSNVDAARQSWLFIPYQPRQPLGEGRYILTSALSELIELDVSGDTGDIPDGTNVQVWNDTCASQFNSFDVIKLSNGYYTLRHVASGKVLTAVGGGSAFGSNVALYAANGSSAQQWAITSNGEGFTLRVKSSGYALDVNGAATADGTNVGQYPWNYSKAQIWHFRQAEHAVVYKVEGAEDVVQTKYYNNDLLMDHTIPLKDGYEFLGWSTQDGDETVEYYAGGIISTDSDLTLYPVWREKDLMDEADMILPAALTAIEEEAFTGLDVTTVICPESLEEIGARAFANCASLRQIYIPAGCTGIASTAFSGCTDLIIYGSSGSVAQAFAKKKGFAFVAYER